MKCIKKPEIVEAIQYTGDNYDELRIFSGQRIGKPLIQYEPEEIVLKTTLGGYVVHVDDFVIKDVRGNYFVCRPETFEEIYEIVE